MSKNLRNVCCVCSGNGETDIFNRIPANFHSNPNEFVYWTKSIAEMIGELSGVYVSYFGNAIGQKCIEIIRVAFSSCLQLF